ncbi:MAG: sugar phosphate nucleotidyltransferase [Nanoarchaeota archaeon]|nr:sugar phosphate nucleotidyltransferase [Nanoarchaeota archaeon]
MKEKISITIDKGLLKGVDSIVDNLHIRNRSQAFEHLVSAALGANRTAVILAGGPEEHIRLGDGYRMTAKVKGKEVVVHALEKLRESGFKNIFIVARKNALSAIFHVVRDGSLYGVRVSYVEEKTSEGSADSLRLVKGKVETEFLVVYGDLLFSKVNLEELWKDQVKNSAAATLLMTTSSQPSEKGTLKVEGNKILAFTQKPKQSDIYLVFSPIFMASPAILEQPGASLEKDVFPSLASRGLLNGHLSSEKEKHIHTLQDAKGVFL